VWIEDARGGLSSFGKTPAVRLFVPQQRAQDLWLRSDREGKSVPIRANENIICGGLDAHPNHGDITKESTRRHADSLEPFPLLGSDKGPDLRWVSVEEQISSRELENSLGNAIAARLTSLQNVEDTRA